MADPDTRSDYMLFEGGLFGASCALSILCYVAVMVCLFSSKKQRNNRLTDASTHLIRAGEAFTDAAVVLLREEREESRYDVVNGDDSSKEAASLEIQPPTANTEAVSNSLSRIGVILQKTGCMLIQQGVYPKENESGTSRPSSAPDNRETVQILGKYTEVIELLNIARESLKSAGRWLIEAAGGTVVKEKGDAAINNPLQKKLELLEDVIKNAGTILQSPNGTTNPSLLDAGNMLRDISTLISPELVPKKAPAQVHTSCSMKLHSLLDGVPNLLFSVYRIVFRQSVEEVTILGPGTTRREYLFGGYGIPRRPWWLHAYFLAMLLIVANWFFVMFFDTAFYRKTTTCNDLNVRRDAYLCFDISKPITAGPTNCTDPEIRDNLDIYVLCYLQFFNFPIALSLAFSFAQLIIILIHISFAITLWCVKNYTPIAAIVLHAALCIVYVLFFVVYGPIVGTNAVNNVKFEGTNIFYGDRILRMFMVLLGFFSLLLLTLLSPYYWLIDKHHRAYCPTYGHEGKKKV